jgi:hypothetical protein
MTLKVPGQFLAAGPNTAGALTLAGAATPQALFVAGEAGNGGVIENPLLNTATGQNITPTTAESIWYDLTGAVPVMAAGGTSMELAPGQTVALPGGLVNSVSWIAATAGHRIAAYRW